MFEVIALLPVPKPMKNDFFKAAQIYLLVDLTRDRNKDFRFGRCSELVNENVVELKVDIKLNNPWTGQKRCDHDIKVKTFFLRQNLFLIVTQVRGAP